MFISSIDDDVCSGQCCSKRCVFELAARVVSLEDKTFRFGVRQRVAKRQVPVVSLNFVFRQFDLPVDSLFNLGPNILNPVGHFDFSRYVSAVNLWRSHVFYVIVSDVRSHDCLNEKNEGTCVMHQIK